MKKMISRLTFVFLIGSLFFAALNANNMTEEKVYSFGDNTISSLFKSKDGVEPVYRNDSILLYNGKGVSTAVAYSFYDENKRQVTSNVVDIAANGSRLNGALDSTIYNEAGQKIRYTYYIWTAGEWIPNKESLFFYGIAGRTDSIIHKRYRVETAEWESIQRVSYIFGENGEILEEIFSDPNYEVPGQFVYFYKHTFSNFNELLPDSMTGSHYRIVGVEVTWKFFNSFSYKYNDAGLKIKEEEFRTVEEEIIKTEIDEWQYNNRGQLISSLNTQWNTYTGAYVKKTNIKWVCIYSED